MTTSPIRVFALLAAAVLPACAAAQSPPKPVPTIPLATAGLAGQGVAVLPLTMAVTDPQLPAPGSAGRAALLQLADSLLAELLQERAPEVRWIFPAELRRQAARAPGVLPSPDQMGQSVMRSPRIQTVPDPLRAHLRQLVAISGGVRYAFIPAAMTLAPATGDSLEVELAVVLTDGRLGTVLWRTRAVGRGESAAAALRVALASLVPVEML